MEHLDARLHTVITSSSLMRGKLLSNGLGLHLLYGTHRDLTGDDLVKGNIPRPIIAVCTPEAQFDGVHASNHTKRYET